MKEFCGKSRTFVALLVLASASTAFAHPLGNSTISHFNVLYILRDRFELDLVLDIAETPSVSVQQEMDADGDGEDSSEERNSWLDSRAKKLAPEFHVVLDGQRHVIQTVDEARDPKTGKKSGAARVITKMPGIVGMPTYQMLIRYIIQYPKPLAPGEHTLEFHDRTYVDMPGLKRIILEKVPDIEFMEPHPAFWGDGPSPFIWEQYDPGNLPQETKATIRFRVPAAVEPPDRGEAKPTSPPEQAPAVSSQPSQTRPAEDVAATDDTAWPEQYKEFAKLDRSQQSTYQKQADRLIGLLTGRDTGGRWGITIFILITAISFGYGAVHALMPGHAKTIVAAYLISQKGTYWHAVLLAIIVTITHTLLVVLLGLVIWIYQKTHPTIGNTLQMYLGVISGLLVAGMGFFLVWRAMSGGLGVHHHHHHHHDEDLPWWRKLFTHSHPEVSNHDHHHEHSHEHPHAHGTPDPGQELTLRTLLVLGVTGGIVPCPTATIIMLLGIGAGVVVGALYVIAVFSLGLALTLMMVGFTALSSRKVAARIMSDAQHEGELSTGSKRILLQVVPAFSGAVVIVLGCAIAANYLHIMKTGTSLIQWLG